MILRSDTEFGQIGEIMRGGVVGVIISSKSKTFPVGCYAGADVGWTEYAVVEEKRLERLDLPQNAKITDALGVLGEYLSYIHSEI
jgi:NADPH-dependent curcumin reductase CurA